MRIIIEQNAKKIISETGKNSVYLFLKGCAS
ncbi:hypothetical protein J2Z29_000154 [Treponema pedis]